MIWAQRAKTGNRCLLGTVGLQVLARIRPVCHLAFLIHYLEIDFIPDPSSLKIFLISLLLTGKELGFLISLLIIIIVIKSRQPEKEE